MQVTHCVHGDTSSKKATQSINLTLPKLEDPRRTSIEWSVLAIVGSVVVLGCFWERQRRAEQDGILPVMPPSVLRAPAVWRGLLMTLLFFATCDASAGGRWRSQDSRRCS